MRVFDGNGPLRTRGRPVSLQKQAPVGVYGKLGHPWRLQPHISQFRRAVHFQRALALPYDLEGPTDARLRWKRPSLDSRQADFSPKTGPCGRVWGVGPSMALAAAYLTVQTGCARDYAEESLLLARARSEE